MKKSINKIVLILFAFLLIRCGEPAPTELISDNTPGTEADFTVEVLSPSPGDVDYSNGYDSTGIVSDVPRGFFNIISFSKVKDTRRWMSRNQDFAQAVFFDKSQPIYSPRGNLLAYKTKKIGKVKFNGETAAVVPLMVGFFEGGMHKNLNLGPKHVLRRNMMGHMPKPPIADYGSLLNVTIIPDSNQDRRLEGQVNVPEEINAAIIVSGERDKGNLSFTLTWNKGNQDNKIEIILGGVGMRNDNRMPLLRLKTRDDGELKIPNRILKPLPFIDFRHIIVTVIRRKEKKIDNGINGSKTFISSQSIHNLIFDVP